MVERCGLREDMRMVIYSQSARKDRDERARKDKLKTPDLVKQGTYNP
jgi:hypothetical protein